MTILHPNLTNLPLSYSLSLVVSIKRAVKYFYVEVNTLLDTGRVSPRVNKNSDLSAVAIVVDSGTKNCVAGPNAVAVSKVCYFLADHATYSFPSFYVGVQNRMNKTPLQPFPPPSSISLSAPLQVQ